MDNQSKKWTKEELLKVAEDWASQLKVNEAFLDLCRDQQHKKELTGDPELDRMFRLRLDYLTYSAALARDISEYCARKLEGRTK